MTGPVELLDPVYGREVNERGAPIVVDQRWVGLLIPAEDASDRQAAVETLQRYAVEVKGWGAYPGSAGVSGPYEYAWRGETLVRVVRWAPGDRPAGRFWRAVLGEGMDHALPGDAPIIFGDDEPLQL